MEYVTPLFAIELLGKALWVWLWFAGIVTVLLAFDLGVLHKDDHEIGLRESLLTSLGYLIVALSFGAWVWGHFGEASGIAYLTSFVVEKSLSLDNVFVIALVFSFLSIPRRYQHRVLFWGIFGVIVLRALLIGLGATLVTHFGWMLEIFAGFLVFSGVKMWVLADHVPDIESNPLLGFLRRRLRVSETCYGNAFWVHEADPASGRPARRATPLLLALVLIEFVDVVFAVDSIPATFAITTDPFLVYSSNIFAILGLRALYFALAALIYRFRYLKHTLALLLIFIGSKTFVVDFVGPFSPWISLAVTVGLIAGGVLVSLAKARTEPLASTAR